MKCLISNGADPRTYTNDELNDELNSVNICPVGLTRFQKCRILKDLKEIDQCSDGPANGNPYGTAVGPPVRF